MGRNCGPIAVRSASSFHIAPIQRLYWSTADGMSPFHPWLKRKTCDGFSRRAFLEQRAAEHAAFRIVRAFPALIVEVDQRVLDAEVRNLVEWHGDDLPCIYVARAFRPAFAALKGPRYE